MSRDILVPIDGSEPAEQALEFALEHHSDADITVFYVVNIAAAADEMVSATPVYEDELYEAHEEHAESVLEDAERTARAYDTEIETEYVRGLPREAILDYAERHSVDQIIMGSHGRSGVKRVVIGSVAEKISRHAPAPVTIVRPETVTA